MVVCRELSVCVFDSTSPHEKFPSLTNDSILDFYKNSGLEGVDEKLEAKLNDVKLRYGKMMSLSKIYMEEIYDLYKKFESKTVADTDYQLLNNIVYEILRIVKRIIRINYKCLTFNAFSCMIRVYKYVSFGRRAEITNYETVNL